MGQEISLSRKNRNRMLKKDFNDQSRQSTSIEFNDIDYFKDNVNFPLNVVKPKVSSIYLLVQFSDIIPYDLDGSGWGL